MNITKVKGTVVDKFISRSEATYSGPFKVGVNQTCDRAVVSHDDLHTSRPVGKRCFSLHDCLGGPDALVQAGHHYGSGRSCGRLPGVPRESFTYLEDL